MAALAAFTAVQAQAAATVEVNYVEPEKFADIGFSAVDRERVLKSLAAFLKALGEQKLPDGQTLKIEIVNVDLAGESRFTRQGELRVLGRRADWPRVELRYELSAGNQTTKSGEAKIYDLAYLDSMPTALIDGDLGYEKRMLRRWFRETFAVH
jgi:hypothetical protein